MKTTRFTEAQIVQALKEYETGKKVEAICRDLGVKRATFYNWKKKYSGMDGDQLKRLKELEQENQRLRKVVADQTIDISILKEAARGNF